MNRQDMSEESNKMAEKEEPSSFTKEVSLHGVKYIAYPNYSLLRRYHITPYYTAAYKRHKYH